MMPSATRNFVKALCMIRGKCIFGALTIEQPTSCDVTHTHVLTVLADEAVLPVRTEAGRLVPSPPVGALHAHTVALKRRAPTALGVTRRPVGPRDVT